jgi:hypothetical protein
MPVPVESEFVLIVGLCQRFESLLIVEEVLEHPQLAQLKEGDSLARWMTSKVDAFNSGWLGSEVDGTWIDLNELLEIILINHYQVSRLYVLEEAHHSLIFVEHDPMLYEDAKEMVEYIS